MRLVITIDFNRGAREEEPERDSSTDALLERADPHAPPIGFVPMRSDATQDLRQKESDR